VSPNEDPAPSPEVSLYGMSVSPDEPPRPQEPLPAPAAGFTFVRELGRGGMGVVYEAIEEAGGRHVALKVIANRLSQSRDATERFEREARLAGSISHPNCVFVYGAHSIHGAPAISMELMTGQTLEDRVKSREPIPTPTAVRWAIEILNGLEAAHTIGIVHRDVKPSNCFLTADEHVKVGDFGLSRSIEGNLGLTQSGAFLGSPLYASPEQVRGRAIDQRADVYSVGATLYTLLAGRPPHVGSAIGDVLAQIVSETPRPISTERPGISRALEALVMRALAKDPAKRFQDCAAFRRALLPYAPGNLTPATLGLRIVAFIIDQMIVSLIYQGACLGLYYAGVRWASPVPKTEAMPGGPWGVIASYAAVLVWFAVLENRFGASVGKKLLGLRVTRVDGGHTELWRTTLRAAVFLTPLALPNVVFGASEHWAPGLVRVGAFLVPLITMRKTNGYRGIHELASGTRVLRSMEIAGTTRARAVGHEQRKPATGFPATIGGYAVEGLVGATDRGSVLVARDPNLERSVWIHVVAGGAGSARSTEPPRPSGLRFLKHGDGPLAFEVYESPGGAALRDHAAAHGSLAWPSALEDLRSLIGEMSSRVGDVALEQLWVDRHGRIRVLDFAIDGKSPGGPVEVLAAATRLLLVGDASSNAVLPSDLPIHAEKPVRRLLGLDPPFASLAEARAALDGLTGRPVILSRPRRVGQIVLVSLWFFFVGLIVFLAVGGETTMRSGNHAEDVAPAEAAIFVAGVFFVPSILLAFALRGGLTYAMLGIGLRNRRGLRASRWRSALRATLVCLPALPALLGMALGERLGQVAPLAGAGISVLTYAGLAAWSVWHPHRGPADMVAGTTLVRR
jgi:uncharacterized RDD family membrane protein YckC